MSVTRDEFEDLARRVRAMETDPLLVIVNRHTAVLDTIQKEGAKHADLVALRDEIHQLAETASTKEDVDALNAKLDQIIRQLP
jgi:hypothetical protein